MGLASGSKSSMEEIAVVLRRFGDEQSTLLDQFERLSFEVQLNQAILRRSFSEPTVGLSKLQAPLQLPSPAVVNAKPKAKAKGKAEARQGRRGSGFSKALKKVLRAFLLRKGNSNNNGGSRRKEAPDPRNPKYFKALSRSLRL